MDSPVEHERASARFVARTPGGVAQLRYRMTAPTVMDIESTYVPSSARGQGVGAALVEQALEYARARGFEVIPSCWYVRTWVDRHPEFEPLLRR
jgi:predicted GNAT family acetyltransferase